jgi:hypothetical protein
MEKLSLKIQDLGLSVRSKNWLITSNIIYAGDLIQKTDEELLAIHNFGRTCLREVQKLLKTFDLELGLRIPEWQTLSRTALIKEFDHQQSLKRISHPPSIKLDKDILVKLLTQSR